jgi:hypothetical protein
VKRKFDLVMKQAQVGRQRLRMTPIRGAMSNAAVTYLCYNEPILGRWVCPVF